MRRSDDGEPEQRLTQEHRGLSGPASLKWRVAADRSSATDSQLDEHTGINLRWRLSCAARARERRNGRLSWKGSGAVERRESAASLLVASGRIVGVNVGTPERQARVGHDPVRPVLSSETDSNWSRQSRPLILGAADTEYAEARRPSLRTREPLALSIPNGTLMS